MGGYDPVLVISGQSLRYALAKQNRASFMKLAINMKTVICARVSPSQKAEVVKLVTQTLGKDTITLAIGDGANDVPMIQEANIGVGISGKEGLQAANSSDYALPQFRFLEKLLLVHGVWNYYRVTKTILYSFYKNVLLQQHQLWFAPFNLFSGQNLFERWSLGYYNAIFTMLPPFAIGIFERPYTKEFLVQNPSVYQKCQSGKLFNFKSFLFYMINACYHSLCLYFLCSNVAMHETLSSNGKTSGLTFLGNMVFFMSVLTVTYKALLESTVYTWFHFWLIVTSPFCWFLYLVIYSNIFPMSNFGDGIMSGQSSNIFSSAIFWLASLICPMFVCMPDFMWRIWQEVVLCGRGLTGVEVSQSRMSMGSLRRSGRGEDGEVVRGDEICIDLNSPTNQQNPNQNSNNNKEVEMKSLLKQRNIES